MKVKASVSLYIDGDRLIYAGRGYQPKADFPQGVIIGEAIISGDKLLEVQTPTGILKVAHGNYIEVEN